MRSHRLRPRLVVPERTESRLLLAREVAAVDQPLRQQVPFVRFARDDAGALRIVAAAVAGDGNVGVGGQRRDVGVVRLQAPAEVRIVQPAFLAAVPAPAAAAIVPDRRPRRSNRQAARASCGRDRSVRRGIADANRRTSLRRAAAGGDVAAAASDGGASAAASRRDVAKPDHGRCDERKVQFHRIEGALGGAAGVWVTGRRPRPSGGWGCCNRFNP